MLTNLQLLLRGSGVAGRLLCDAALPAWSAVLAGRQIADPDKNIGSAGGFSHPDSVPGLKACAGKVLSVATTRRDICEVIAPMP